MGGSTIHRVGPLSHSPAISTEIEKVGQGSPASLLASTGPPSLEQFVLDTLCPVPLSTGTRTLELGQAQGCPANTPPSDHHLVIPDFRLEKHAVASETNKQPENKNQTCVKYLHLDVYKMLYQELGFLFAHEQMDETERVKIRNLSRNSYLPK